ncbi:pentatricopeptide repeat-containing protein At3g20730 [Magnolia sinica]|uniref:pentatricopeptide repeat-containing protein At3g20730 n=1 Tax=Magnolia sinica TaxID=86752 RepID=UPI002658A087|nr:pentatricopeptide repeat-containing protein At3g20730 [Magnolia sinica]
MSVSDLLFTQCKLGRLKQAFQTLSYLHPLSPPLSPSLYSSLLQLCIDSNAEKEGRVLYHHLLQNCSVSDLHLNTKFIVFYSKIGDLDAARRVFDGMPQRSVVSWTALISGYSRNGYLREALELFLLMRQSGFKANQFSYGSVLRACTGLLCIKSGKQIQGCIEKSQFCGDLFVQSALVDLHSKCGRIEDAIHVFEKMLHRDVVCWNALIGGCTVQGLGDFAFRMLPSMLRDGIMPDHFTFGSVLRGCGGVRALVKVTQIHGFIVHLGFESYRVVIGSLIDAYGKCKSLSSARLLYDSMLEKDLISSTALITGYAQEGSHYSGEALELFSKINQMGMGVDDIIMCSMLNVCANVASLSLGQQIHAHALKNRLNHDVALGNALIDMYAKSGEIEDARRAFDGMQEKNVISWTSLMVGYGKHGYGKEAILLFEMMEDKGLKPNDVTFLSLLFACSHTGLTNEGWDCFNSMVIKYNIQPRAEHYSCMVDLLARGGQLKEAYDLVSKMNVKPNASLWGAVLGACRIYGNKSLGEIAAAHLFDLDPMNPVNYVVLANIYTAAGLWEDAWNTRKMMEERCIKKEPGYSCIQFTKKRIALLL